MISDPLAQVRDRIPRECSKETSGAVIHRLMILPPQEQAERSTDRPVPVPIGVGGCLSSTDDSAGRSAKRERNNSALSRTQNRSDMHARSHSDPNCRRRLAAAPRPPMLITMPFPCRWPPRAFASPHPPTTAFVLEDPGQWIQRRRPPSLRCPASRLFLGAQGTHDLMPSRSSTRRRSARRAHPTISPVRTTVYPTRVQSTAPLSRSLPLQHPK
jgi:hypothetical protein